MILDNEATSFIKSDADVERIWPTRDTLSRYLVDYKDHRQRYEFAKDLVKGKVIADIACGVGYGSYMLGDVADSVRGFDISQEALSHADQHFSRSNVSFSHASEMPVSCFEVIVSFETLEHLHEQDGDLFLRTLHSALVTNGILLISTPINRNRPEDRVNVTKYHLREYDEIEFLEKLTANGFTVRKVFGQWNSVTETLAKRNAFGFSWGSIIRSGVHRIIPAGIRQPLANLMLQKEYKQVNDSVRIVADDLTGAFVQIAVCDKK